jgi:chitodextrinase
MRTAWWTLTALGVAVAAGAEPTVVTWPAPAGEAPSPDWQVSVAGKPVFIGTIATLNAGPASFGSFDFAGAVEIVVRSTRPVRAARVLPSAWGLTPRIEGDTLRLTLDRPRNLTFVINDNDERALHLFANPLEVDPPQPNDPNVLYFGPGVHDLGPTQLKAGQTVYLAGGAIVRPTIPAAEQPTRLKDWSGVPNWRNLFQVSGAKGLTVRGRGVLDMSRLPWHARTAFVFGNCEDVLVEGITILDAPAWVVAFFGCRRVTVRNIKQICRRENSDGVDLCNTQDALVEDSFLRNNDDEVCVKTTSPAPAQESRNIVVRRCVVWNERARGLGITSETRRNISNVLFADCDIIRDYARGGDCAALAVLVSDSGTMSNIRFEDIRVEHCRHSLINMWVGADMWGHDKERGRVDGVTFRNIRYTGAGTPLTRVNGYDAQHRIENVTFEFLRLGDRLVNTLAAGRITCNAHTANIRVVSDEQPPTQAPTVTAQVLPGDPAVKLSWPPVAAPPSGIDHYNVYRGEAKVGQAPGGEFVDHNLAEQTAYTWRVAAVSGADLESPRSAPVQATTGLDTTPPRVTAAEALGERRVRVVFSERVSGADRPACYALDGGAQVLAAALEPDGRGVVLTTSALTSGRKYALAVRDVTDRAAKPNTLAPARLELTWHSGLLGWWRLDDGQGLVAADASGQGLAGKLHGLDAATCWVAGGVRCNGETSYIELPAAPALDKLQDGDYTLLVRFAPDGLPPGTGNAYNGAYGLVLKRGYHEGLTYTRDGKFSLTHWLQGDLGSGASSPAASPPGKSYHVAGVVDRTKGELRLFIDGQCVARAPLAPGAVTRAYPNERWRIGTGNTDTRAGYAWPAKGVLGDVRLYARALTDEEIAGLAAGSSK